MKHLYYMLSVSISLLATAVFSQEVVAPAGNYHENAQGSICWTLGEAVIHTYQNNNHFILQGFQQSFVTVATLVDEPMDRLHLVAFPNPTRDLVTITSGYELEGTYRYEVFDMVGQLLAHDQLTMPETHVGFSHFLPGTYMIRVTSNPYTVKTFLIIKQ